MAKAPCARLMKFIRPSVTESPHASTNSSIPYAIPSNRMVSMIRPSPPRHSGSGIHDTAVDIIARIGGYGFRVRGFTPAPRNDELAAEVSDRAYFAAIAALTGSLTAGKVANSTL